MESSAMSLRCTTVGCILFLLPVLEDHDEYVTSPLLGCDTLYLKVREQAMGVEMKRSEMPRCLVEDRNAIWKTQEGILTSTERSSLITAEFIFRKNYSD